MLDLISEFANLIDALQADALPFAVCGGIALAMHGHPRFTADIDLLVPLAEFERIEPVVNRLGFVFDSGEMTLSGVTLRRLTKIVGTDHLVLDLLFVEPAWVAVWNDRVWVEWEGRRLPVVSGRGLARMKRRAARPQDLVDIQTLGFDLDDPTLQ